jgi:hypothetical protein
MRNRRLECNKVTGKESLFLIREIGMLGVVKKRVIYASLQAPTIYTKLNSVAGVRERIIPTERPLLVSEVSSIFCG